MKFCRLYICNKNMILIKMWLVRFYSIRVMQLCFFFFLFFNSLNLTNFSELLLLTGEFSLRNNSFKVEACFHVVFIYNIYINVESCNDFIDPFAIMMITIFVFLFFIFFSDVYIWFKRLLI